jgi:myo-inositol-1(or 4)-monophosphatase
MGSIIHIFSPERLVYIEKKIRGLRSKLQGRTQESLGINFKTSHTDIVTLYDQMVENFLCEEIGAAFPDDVFFTEEETHNTLGEKMWIIDPIDGTCNFAVKKREYAISIAYYEEKI